MLLLIWTKNLSLSIKVDNNFVTFNTNLDSLEENFSDKFSSANSKLGDPQGQIHSVEQQIDNVGVKFLDSINNLDSRFHSLATTVNQIDNKFISLENKVDENDS